MPPKKKPTNHKEGVAPPRTGEGSKRQDQQALALTLPPAPALAQNRAGAKTSESASRNISDDDLLEEIPMDTVPSTLEKKDLLALRQGFKRAKCNYDKVCSHLDFIHACMEEAKTPNGLQVRVKCNALLKDMTSVQQDFQHTKTKAEHEFEDSLKTHYIKVKDKLSENIARLEAQMTIELGQATSEEKKTHDEMMEKTIQNIKKQQLKLEDRKKRKLEGLLQPPEKRTRQTEGERKSTNPRNRQRQTQTANTRRNGQGNRQTPTNQNNATTASTNPNTLTAQNDQANMATLATLLQKLLPPGNYMQQPPMLLHNQPCAPGQQQPPLLAPGVSVLPGQPPPLSGQYQQGFR